MPLALLEQNLKNEKRRATTMGASISGMDSATVIRMNRNRKNLPTKGNENMKLGNLMNSKIFMRRVKSQTEPQGTSMLEQLQTQ